MALGWRDIVPIGLIVIGLGLLVFGQFYVTKSGAYLFVAEEPTQQYALPEDATVVAFEDLSERMQQKFERRLAGKTTYVGSESEAADALPWGLYDIGYVRYQGDYYETGISVAHPPVIPRSLIRVVGGLIMAIGLIWTGRRVVKGSIP